jgi:hypothetical protein
VEFFAASFASAANNSAAIARFSQAFSQVAARLNRHRA